MIGIRKEEPGMRKTGFLLLAAFLFAVTPIMAGEGDGFKTSSDLEVTTTTLIELKLRFNQSFIFPFLQGQNPLVEDNNIKLVLSASVTPISLIGIGEIIWTPAAFFMLSGGADAGSGWNLPIADGLGINAPVDKNAPSSPPRKAKIYGNAFDGLVWSAWGAGTFQFDLGAIFPGDWTHVVFMTRQEFRYSANTGAGAKDSWIFENDEGENRNGWKYLANYVLGYQMPLSPVLSMIGVMAELDKNFYNAPGGDFWGDSLGLWHFSGFGVLSITPRFDTTVIIQMKTHRNHGLSLFNNDYYYQDLKIEKEDGKRRLLFYRLALIFSYRLR